MAVNNPISKTDQYGTTYTVYTNGTSVYIYSSLVETPWLAFTQDVADNPVDFEIGDDDSLYIHHIASGAPAIQKSSLNGESGSWSAV